jgi:hypothetical protein
MGRQEDLSPYSRPRLFTELQVPEGKKRKGGPHGDAEGQPRDQPRDALAIHLTSVLIRKLKHPVKIPGPFSQPGWSHTPRIRAVLCMNWRRDVAPMSHYWGLCLPGD